MVSLHIDMFVDDLLASFTLEVSRSIGGKSPGRKVGFRWVVDIPTYICPRRKYACRHVVDSPVRDGAIQDSDGQVGTWAIVSIFGPKDVRRRHTPEAVPAVENFVTGLFISLVWLHRWMQCVCCVAREMGMKGKEGGKDVGEKGGKGLMVLFSVSKPRRKRLEVLAIRTMVMSRPARAELTPECCAPQSVYRSDTNSKRSNHFLLAHLTSRIPGSRARS